MENSTKYSSGELENKLSELRLKRESLIKEINQLNKGLKMIDLEIAKWMIISPNQFKIDFDDNN